MGLCCYNSVKEGNAINNQMNFDSLVSDIDDRIKRLTIARQALTGGDSAGDVPKPAAKRVVSAAARARMATAQQKSWAKRRKAAKVIKKAPSTV